VLEKLASLDLDTPQTEALNYLKSLISLLEQCFRVQSGQSTFAFDLRSQSDPDLDYYTGIVFEVVSDIESNANIRAGGRYDQLLGLYHPQGETIPGIGFALISKTYSKFCFTNQLPKHSPASNWLYQRTLLMPPPLPMQKNSEIPRI